LADKFDHYSNGTLTSTDPTGFAGINKYFRTAVPDLKFTYDIVAAKANKAFVK
jgi:hypothetical protein